MTFLDGWSRPVVVDSQGVLWRGYEGEALGYLEKSCRKGSTDWQWRGGGARPQNLARAAAAGSWDWQNGVPGMGCIVDVLWGVGRREEEWGREKGGPDGSLGSTKREQGQGGPSPTRDRCRKRRGGVRCMWHRGKRGPTVGGCVGVAKAGFGQAAQGRACGGDGVQHVGALLGRLGLAPMNNVVSD
jgi:hypothetical protein